MVNRELRSLAEPIKRKQVRHSVLAAFRAKHLTRNILWPVGETGFGWGEFWLGQCPSGPNESPHGETNEVFGEHVTTAITGATRIIDVGEARAIRDI